jgi:hypothetical protein
VKPDTFGYHWWYKSIHVPNAGVDSDSLTPLHPGVVKAREEVVERRRNQISAEIIRAVQRAFDLPWED